MNSNADKQIIWFGIAIALPPDWSISRHSVDPYQGRLIFVDRYQQRGELVWHQCTGTPDIEHSLDDYRKRVLGQHPDTAFQSFTCKDWRGFTYTADTGCRMTRALCYTAAHHRLLDLLLIGDDSNLVHRLYRQCKSVTPASTAVEYQAFGIHCTIPHGWRLTRATVKPMDIMFRFTPVTEGRKQARAEAWIRRLTMVDDQYKKNGEELIRMAQPQLNYRFTTVNVRGHSAVCAEADKNQTLFDRLLGKTRQRRELLWVCPAENALFHLVTENPKSKPVHPDQFIVHCPKG